MRTFSFIFVGDTHGAIDDFRKQKEIIETYAPEFVLAENLQDIRLDTQQKFKDMNKRKFISDTVKFDEVKKLINLCEKKEIALIGIDLHNFGLDENLRKAIASAPTAGQKEKIEAIVKKRQQHHLKKIHEFAKKTSKPIVVILGAWHLQENSLLMTSLDNYRVVFPCDANGNLVFGPTKNEMYYCERTR